MTPKLFITKAYRKIRRQVRRLRGMPLYGPDELAAAYWDREVTTPHAAASWTAFPGVTAYVNETVTGVAWLFPLVALKAGWAFKPWKRVLSLGCGTGSLERNLRWLRIAEHVDAWDASAVSVAEARAAAVENEVDGIDYFVGNIEHLRLAAGTYDASFSMARCIMSSTSMRSWTG